MYRARRDGVSQLYQRRLDEFEATVIPGTEGAGREAVFSFDSRWLGFMSADQTTLMKVELAGGLPVTLSNLTSAPYRSASWGADDTIILSQRGGGLVGVAGAGGDPVVIAPPPEDGSSYWYPQILPGERSILVTACPSRDDCNVALLDRETAELRTLVQNGVAGKNVPSGHLVFVRENSLWATGFDLENLEAVGSPIVVEQGIRVEGGGAVQLAVADDGTLAYIPGGVLVGGAGPRQLVWVDRDGNEEVIEVPPGLYAVPRISPDGNRLALQVYESDNIDVRIWDFNRQNMTRLTSDAAPDRSPVWSVDGESIFFSSLRDGAGVYRRASNGTGQVEALISGQPDRILAPNSLDSDGNTLVLRSLGRGGAGNDISTLTLDGSHQVLLDSPFEEMGPVISPNGKWIAYQSDETGEFEVYVRPFPEVETDRFLVSNSGGTNPLWSRDGRELFYDDGRGIVAVAVETDQTFSSGTPEILFRGAFVYNDPRNWDISADGERFLMIKRLGEGRHDRKSSKPPNQHRPQLVRKTEGTGAGALTPIRLADELLKNAANLFQWRLDRLVAILLVRMVVKSEE